MYLIGIAILGVSGPGWPRSSPPQSNPQTAAQPSISGTISYRERIALPPDAAIEVKLQDVSQATPKTIAESVFAPEGKQVPIPFQLSYNQADINPAHTYKVQANISVNGKPMFTSTTAEPVITNGAPSQVSLMLQQAPASSAPTSATKLRGTHWVLAELNGKPAEPGEGETAHLVLHKKGRLSGSTGCNLLSGTYIAEQGALQFTPAGMTMKACSQPVMAQEQALLAALKATNKYQIEGETLELLNGSQLLAKFQAKPTK
jgi:putative lipoprotein